MNENVKKSKGIMLLGMYLIVIGVFWSMNIGFFKIQQNRGSVIYDLGQNVLAGVSTAAVNHQWRSPSDKLNYDNKYNELKKSLEKYKAQHIDSPSSLALLISFVGLLTSLAYIMAGFNVLNTKLNAKKYIKWGFVGFIAHYLLLVGGFIIIFSYIKQSEDLLLVFEESVSLYEGWIVPVGAMVLISVIFSSIAYILLPRIFFGRPRIKAQLK